MNMKKPDPKQYLTPVTVSYLKGKNNGQLYPVDADEAVVEYAIAAQGGPRSCGRCGDYFTSRFTGRGVCDECLDVKKINQFTTAKPQVCGPVILSLTSGEYGCTIEDFLDQAERADDPEDGISESEVVLRCRLVNPSPNQLPAICWENISDDCQPGEGDFIEPSGDVDVAIDRLNQALLAMSPLSYGPDWDTRLPMDSDKTEL
jgi:hypothetical protein